MRTTHLIALGACALVFVHSNAAEGQGRRGGGGGRRGGSSQAGGRGVADMKVLNDGDLDKVDPGRVLLEKSKALKLSDQQKHALDSVVTRFEWNAHQFSKNVDSLYAAGRHERVGDRRGDAPAADSGGTEEQATHRALLENIQAIRDEFTAASSHSLERLTDDQRTQAKEWLDTARAKLEDLLARA